MQMYVLNVPHKKWSWAIDLHGKQLFIRKNNILFIDFNTLNFLIFFLL